MLESRLSLQVLDVVQRFIPKHLLFSPILFSQKIYEGNF